MADLETPGFAAFGLPACREFPDGRLVPGDHGGRRSVDGGEGHLGLASGECGQNLLLGRPYGHHRATGRQRAHQPATRHHQGAAVVEGEDPGGVCRRELADGVPDQQVRHHAPVLQQPVQRRLQGEEGRLGVLRAVQQRGLRGALRREHHLAQGPLGPVGTVRVDSRAHLVQRPGERLEGLVQPPPHPRTLAALPGEEERGPATPDLALDHLRGGLPERQSVKGRQHVIAVGGEQHRPVLEDGTGRGQRVRHVRRSYTGCALQVGVEAPGLRAQGLVAPAGDRQEQDGRLRRTGLSGRGRPGR